MPLPFNSDQEQGRDCTDPCHAGLSHFGHGACLTAYPFFRIRNITYVEQVFQVTPLIQDGPFLEGPRKPPRLG